MEDVNVLTKKQKEAIDFLERFVVAVKKGETLTFNWADLTELKKMGITFDFVSHHKVKELYSNRKVPFLRYISNAPFATYLKGKETRVFLPFQIKEYKPFNRR